MTRTGFKQHVLYKLIKDPKDYPNFKFEIIFQTFQKVKKILN